MARSYPSRRFPGGPYIEPSVTPALRGPKRTGPIGELVPGDDVEVARILARHKKGPKRQPVVYKIKLQGDTADELDLEVGDGWFKFYIDEDCHLMELISVRLGVTTVSSDGDVVVQLRKSPAQTLDEEGVLEPLGDDVDLFVTDEGANDFRLRIEEGHYSSGTSSIQPEIDLAHSQVVFADRFSVDLDEVGVDVRGLEITLTFK